MTRQLTPHGAEDAYYLGRQPPYRVANRAVAEIGELLLVKGFSAERLRRLEPYLTALPGTTRVNVNAASAELLAALLPGVSVSTAKAIVAARDKEPYGSKMEFARRLPASAAQAANDLLDVRSDYFVVRGTVRVGRIAAGYRALVGREGPAVRSIAAGLRLMCRTPAIVRSCSCIYPRAGQPRTRPIMSSATPGIRGTPARPASPSSPRCQPRPQRSRSRRRAPCISCA